MKIIGLLCVAAFCDITAQASTIVSTYSSWDGVLTANGFGNDGSGANFGQTFTVPTNGDNILTSFSLVLDDGPIFTFPFHADVSAWNPVTDTMGTPLFSQATQMAGTSSYVLDSYTFSPNVTLTPGGIYAIYFVVDGTTTNHTYFGVLGSSADPYTAGYYIAGLNGTWWTYPSEDVVFSATFSSASASSVPEPAPAMLAAVAAALLGWGRWRRSIRCRRAAR